MIEKSEKLYTTLHSTQLDGEVRIGSIIGDQQTNENKL